MALNAPMDEQSPGLCTNTIFRKVFLEPDPLSIFIKQHSLYLGFTDQDYADFYHSVKGDFMDLLNKSKRERNNHPQIYKDYREKHKFLLQKYRLFY